MKKIFSILSVLLLAGCSAHQVAPIDLCVGTYGKHYYKVSFCDGVFGEAQPVEAADASFVLPVGDNVVYAVSEHDPRSGICSFRDDCCTAFNKEIGGSPCYLMQLGSLPFIATADYNGGSISVFQAADGVVGKRVQCLSYQGTGPVEGRQTQSHVHQLKTIPQAICTQLGIQGTWLLATDLGCDSIHVLSVNEAADANSTEVLKDVPWLTLALPAGSGPRHMEFNEARGLLYCITELSGDVLTWKIGVSEGVPTFTRVQLLKADDADAGGSADIHLHPSGRFLYTSHRLKDDGISLFRVREDGLLERIGKVRTESHPRHFLITPDGRYLLAACRDGHCVQVFALDVETGNLTDTGQRLETGTDGPVCVALVK